MQFTKKILDDLVVACRKEEVAIPTIIFTLTICGSVRTLHFMEWLGIHIPDEIKEDLKSCENAAVRSKELAVEIARDLIQYCNERSIPFGFNIESVATQKKSGGIACVVSTIGGMLTATGLRKKINTLIKRSQTNYASFDAVQSSRHQYFA